MIMYTCYSPTATFVDQKERVTDGEETLPVFESQADLQEVDYTRQQSVVKYNI